MPWEGLAPLSAREDAKVARLWRITAVLPAVSVAVGLVVPAIHLPDGMAEISEARTERGLADTLRWPAAAGTPLRLDMVRGLAAAD